MSKDGFMTLQNCHLIKVTRLKLSKQIERNKDKKLATFIIVGAKDRNTVFEEPFRLNLFNKQNKLPFKHK